MKKKAISLLLIISAILLAAISSCYGRGPWKGKVIDAETKQPIEGAAVVVVWNKKFIVPTGSGTTILDVKETITDKSGAFEINKTSFLSIPFLREVQDPVFIFYKPGYSTTAKSMVTKIPIPPYPYHTQSTSDYFQMEGTVVGFPKAVTKEERLHSLSVGSMVDDVPRKKVKYLFQLINEERRCLGIPTSGGTK